VANQFSAEDQQNAKEDLRRYLNIDARQNAKGDWRDEFVDGGGLFGIEQAVVEINALAVAK
jgi:hypothetical protein